MKKIHSVVTLPLISGLLLASPAAFSQQYDPPPPQPQMGPEDAGETLDPQTKKKFIKAFSEVQDIQTEYTRKLEQVNDQSRAQALQQEAQQEMISAVKEQGLSVADYNQITQIVSNNPELMAEIQEKARGR